MSKITEWIDRKFYSNLSLEWDNDYFRKILEEKITPESYCLDYGAGRGKVKQMNFKETAKFVAGIDVDEAVLQNPYLHEAKILDTSNNRIPFEDDTFDIVYSNYVMEHIENPKIVFDEINRVLKPGGVFIAKTPNKWYYVSIMARLTPDWFHKSFNKLRGRKTFDTFPTVYKCNSKLHVIKNANATGFKVNFIQFLEGKPEYLRLSGITYSMGLLYERMVNSSQFLEKIRCLLIFELSKE